MLTPEQIADLEKLAQLQRSPITRLVFGGGGAKGVMYSGVYRAMVDTGAMHNVTEVAGSSVGSVAATLIAVGIDPDGMRSVFDSDLTALLGRRIGRIFGSNPPGTMSISRSTVHGYALVRNQLILAIKAYLNSIQDKVAIIAKYPAVEDIITKLSANNGYFPKITFRDLDILHQIDPTRFKNLLMTATKHPGCELQIFSAHTTPDVEIALAVCASCCIPGFFSPVSIPVFSEDDMWVDGGVHDNMPEGYFDQDENGQLNQNHKKAQTLLFAFSEGSESDGNHHVFDAIHHASKPYETGQTKRFMLELLMPLLASLKPEFSLMKRREYTYQKMREDYPLRTVQLNTSSIGGLSFENATLSSRVLFALGYLDTVAYIVNHQLHEQWTNDKFDDQALYANIPSHFKAIYRAVLLGSRQNINEDALLNKMNERDENNLFKLKPTECLDLIKAKVLEDLYEPVAFALSRALELHQGKITPEALFKETYEESFKHSGYYSVSQVSGESIWRASTLHQKLQSRPMFGLYREQPENALETRLFNVFTELNKLPAFAVAYNEHRARVDIHQEQSAYWSMQVLVVFMATLGVAAIAIAFVALNAATLGASGVVLAIAGGFSVLVGCGLFKEAQNQNIPTFESNDPLSTQPLPNASKVN